MILGNMAQELGMMDARIKKMESAPVNIKIGFQASSIDELQRALTMVEIREPDILNVVHEEHYPEENKNDSPDKTPPEEGSGVASGESL